MIELSAKATANLLPGDRSGMPRAARIFNETIRYRSERIVDFLKLHYMLSRRTDSKFWVDNGRRESIPDSLRECPWHEDFSHREEVFSAASYQYILYGMGFQTTTPGSLLNERDRAIAQEKMHEVARHAQGLRAALPGNRELLAKVRRFGLQKI